MSGYHVSMQLCEGPGALQGKRELLPLLERFSARGRQHFRAPLPRSLGDPHKEPFSMTSRLLLRVHVWCFILTLSLLLPVQGQVVAPATPLSTPPAVTTTGPASTGMFDPTAAGASAAAIVPEPPLATPTSPAKGLANFARLSPDLYRGEQPTKEGFAALAKMGIKTVVNLRALHSDEEKLKGTGLRYINIPIYTWNLKKEQVAQFLKIVTDPAQTPVFVHCQHGSDRTGTMCAIYRMAVQDWPRARAIEELPRFGFHEIWRNLRNFLQGLDIGEMRRLVGR